MPYGCGLISAVRAEARVVDREYVVSLPSGIDVVDRDVRIGDGRLFQILIHAAAAAR